jgi:hypothetical protein
MEALGPTMFVLLMVFVLINDVSNALTLTVAWPYPLEFMAPLHPAIANWPWPMIAPMAMAQVALVILKNVYFIYFSPCYVGSLFLVRFVPKHGRPFAGHPVDDGAY